MTPSSHSTSRLRYALLSNACFSGLSGTLLFAAPHIPAGRLGVGELWLLRLIGAGLMLFCFDLIHQATRLRIKLWRVLLSSLGDFSWVIGTAVMLVTVGGLPTSGTWLLASIALVVMCFGVWQLAGIRAATRLPGRLGHRHCVPVVVNVSSDQLWPALADLGGIQRFMPNLKSSKLLAGKPAGVGAVRACEDDSGRRWAEECVAFTEGVGFTLRFLADAADFPFPARTMTGGWQVMPLSGNQCEVRVWWELELKHDFLAPVLLPLMAFQADRDFPKIVARMAHEVSAGAANQPELPSASAQLALLPC
jgi:ribosome-associated toxin RatA of RatAB toxin-antitoxin module